MKRATLAVVLVGLLASVRVLAGDAGKDDAKKLQGTWQLVEVDGKPAGKEDARARLVVSGDQMALYLDKKKITEGKFKLDAAKKPRHIDLAPGKDGATKGVSLGIYELDGDTFRIMLGSESTKSFNGKEEFVPSKRPKDFKDKSEPVLVFKRVK